MRGDNSRGISDQIPHVLEKIDTKAIPYLPYIQADLSTILRPVWCLINVINVKKNRFDQQIVFNIVYAIKCFQKAFTNLKYIILLMSNFYFYKSFSAPFFLVIKKLIIKLIIKKNSQYLCNGKSINICIN